MIYSRKLRFRKGSWLILPAVVLGLFTSPAKADTFRTEGANDFYFELESGTTFTARADAWQYSIDSQLWLYNSANTVVAVNDDWFGLDSYISYDVQQSGTYRLRTSVCCGDPNRWYRQFYTVETNSAPTNVPTTTTTSTTTTSTTTTSTTTTTIAPYLNTPQNLHVTSTNASKVYLSWDAPSPSNVEVERYAIFWSCNNWLTGQAISSVQTQVSIENLDSGTSCQFKVRADNDTLSVYSNFTEDVTGVTQTTTTTSTTTTSTTSTTTTIAPVVPTTMQPIVTTTELPVPTVTSSTQPDVPLTTVATTTTLSSTTTSRPPQTTILPSTTTSSTTTSTTIVNTTTTLDTAETASVLVTNILASSDNPAELSAAVDNAVASVESPEELASIVTSLLDKPLTDDQFSAVIDAVFTDSLTTEELSAALDAVFAEPISNEKFAEVLSAVLDNPLNAEQFAAVVGILESDSVSKGQVALAVDNILKNGITESQATDLATSPKVLESIDPEQASAVFEQIPVSNLTTEEEKALVEAVSNAPTEVKNAFENAIDIFGSGLDEYVAVGSNVNVGTRRVVIAAIGAVTSITLAAPPAPASPNGSGGGSSGPSGGSNPGTSGSGSESQNRKRKPMGGR